MAGALRLEPQSARAESFCVWLAVTLFCRISLSVIQHVGFHRQKMCFPARAAALQGGAGVKLAEPGLL